MEIISYITNLAAACAELSKNFTQIAQMLKEKPATENAAAALAEKKQAKKGKASSGTSLAESEQPITLEQIRGVLAEKSQAGLTMQVKDLVSSFGSVKLSGIDPAKYPELMEKAKALKVPDGGK